MSEPEHRPPIVDPVAVRVDYLPFVNFAMQQNAVPLVRSLSVENRTEEALRNVSIRLWTDPEVIVGKAVRADFIAPGATCECAEVAVIPLRDHLRQRVEREQAHLWIEVLAGDVSLHKEPLPLSILAYNEWFGVSSLPEIVAAHVLPNNPAVDRILAEASKILLARTQDGSLSGYQSDDPRRAYAQAAAIYFAAGRQGIGYANPPASFEATGQKIRTPEHVLESRLGTCMDTTTLLAACYEQAGLRPVVVLIKDHAFPGVWLGPKSFDDPLVTHPSILVNRIGLGEFIVVESTAITKSPAPTFKVAQKLAQAHLADETKFHYAVEIAAARKMGIRPLSLSKGTGRSKFEEAAAADDETAAVEDLDAPGSVVSGDRTKEAPSRDKESGADRLARWKRNLLDLSYRNRQLNFKNSKKSIPLLCPDIASLEDALANGKAFKVRPRPAAWGEKDPRDARLQREQTGESGLDQFLRKEMAGHVLHADLSEGELPTHLVEIERAARLGMEEGGANTLFLALGFLVYTETPGSTDVRRAPILLIPMSIERTSIRDGFRIHRIDEESRINVTLLEKLRVDFGITFTGLDPLPEDESGLDVPGILRVLRNAIKREPGWRVAEDASIAILTFSRFLMWLDLEANADTLKENGIVRHMVEMSNELYDPSASFPDMDRLDETYPPSATFCPLPADSSQLRAVFASAEGRTYVLQGPPGTGKSQTITNLIAHCLTIGKRVLFVAQKRAALDVVHRRLAGVGLGPFCLELHSNKTTKESFRVQLREAVAVVENGHSDSWEAETARLAELRRELNDYVRDLHQPRAFGKSAYWAISRLARRDGGTTVHLDLGEAEGRTREDYERMRAAVRELAEAARVSGSPAGHPLAALRLAEWVYGIEDDAARAVDSAMAANRELTKAAGAVLPDLGLSIETASAAELETVKELTTLLEQAPTVTPAILTEADWPAARSELSQSIERGRACSALRSKLLETYAEGLFSLEVQPLRNMLQIRKNVWFFKKWRMETKVRKAVRPVRKDQKKPKDLAELEQELTAVLSVVCDTSALAEPGSLPSRLFGSFWQGADSNWEALTGIVEWVDRFRPLLDNAPGANLDAKLGTRAAWIRLATEGRSLFVPGSPGTTGALAFREALAAASSRRASLKSLLHLNERLAWGGVIEAGFLRRVAKALDDLRENLPRLRGWSHYQSARRSACELRLGRLVKALETGAVGFHDLVTTFELSFADWWARTVLKSVPLLAGFIGERHDLMVREFREQDARIAELTKKEIFARIAGGLPRMSIAKSPASSEAGMLQRFTQGGRKSIRRIFRECPNALAKYKPCVLMSPLSVAQFIGADFPKFDVVVFDEASQMPTYEAVGAIARGNQLIVVGDSRQLPPTTFFERQKGDEEFTDDDLPEELESILEEAEAAGIRRLRLDWHYRSRHESLIAFSNRQYYENRLHTFPSAVAVHPALGVHWRPIPNGVYDYGKSRTNRPEAEAVVAEIVRRLTDSQEQGRSLGVVTFSMTQQRLVEDLLDHARGEHPEIETYFTAVDEPVFVKNLETVQGDERDVILFSICYGPDAAGVIRMNFGPLNNKGGERRLNVAITRARRQLLVFSTIRPEQIDLSRTSAIGVHHLRTFLDYARRGPVALVQEVSQAGGEVESPLEQVVKDELTRRGHLVDCQVGCSGYRIDLAIRDSEAPGRYILGIECDGANYHSAKSARDRDRIRQAVLEGLGWRLHRVWSTDWWLQRPKEIAKLEEAIQRAQNASAEPPDIEPTPAVATATGPTIVPSVNPASPAGNLEPVRFASSAAFTASEKAAPIPTKMEIPGSTSYRRYTPDRSFSGEIHDPVNAPTVRELVLAIACAEAPVLLDTLCTEAAFCWGLGRAGSRIREAVRDATRQSGLVIRLAGKREFLWMVDQAMKPLEGFRVPAAGDSRARQVQEICPEEVANAAAYVLSQNISIGADDLARETAGVFGIKRRGANVRAYIDEGIELLKNQGRCRTEGSNLVAV